MCNVEIDCKKIKQVAYGKQPPSPFFPTWFLIEFKTIIPSEASHEVKNCESMLLKAEPQEIIEALEAQW